MPTYEYECKTCGHVFEAFQSMKDEPLKVCPECGRELRRRINGGTGIIFKGNGFYVTDKPSGGKTASEGAPKEQKPDSGAPASPAPAPAASTGSTGAPAPAAAKPSA
ncbi:MAG: zinc ribbon domain-containing protein [Spirochaetaceae bacterium]|jgi:putative FmdB family regulatory protein|nr:zinc ribbon domain-containing protein [Spirochaetaceae bacterium]